MSLFLLVYICIMKSVSSSYHINYTYVGYTFFDDFNFTAHRQHNAFSDFQNKSSAISMGLINTTATTAYIGTDYTNMVGSEGRASIEMSSNHIWDEGLFILNASHMPQGCGTWPAFWFVSLHNKTQNHGEIDVIEGINLRIDDQSTLHTNGACDFSTNYNMINMTGIWRSDEPYNSSSPYNCSYNDLNNTGCGIYANMNNTYGQGFNDNDGGIFAMELNYNIGIRIWFWSMFDENIPNNIYSKTPDVDTWGIPYAFWPFGWWCKSNNFPKMQILFDLYYCGWAAQTNYWDMHCLNVTNNATCFQWVMNNPSYFHDAYWLINYLDVYTM